MGVQGYIGSILATLSVLLASSSSAIAQEAIGEIRFMQNEHLLTVSDEITIQTTGTYDVQLLVEKSGLAGSTKSKQGKRLSAIAGSSYHTSTISLLLQDGDKVNAELKLLQDGQIVLSETRVLSYPRDALKDEKHL